VGPTVPLSRCILHLFLSTYILQAPGTLPRRPGPPSAREGPQPRWLAANLPVYPCLSRCPRPGLARLMPTISSVIPYLTGLRNVLRNLLPSFAGSGLGTMGALAAGLFSTLGPAGTHGRIGHP
ncbi:hypothetical protein CTAM01_02503, partial [Colletotrichum tamarilloi]